jgi:amino-acid N-acetyltransferase
MTAGGQGRLEYLPATPRHRAAVVALLSSSALPTEDLPATLDHFFVAQVGDDLIGVIGLELIDGGGLVRSLAVAPAWQGRKVAHQLWGLALAAARAAAVRELFLLTTTAERIFAHWGFARWARDRAPAWVRNTPEFRSLCPDTAALMRWAVEADGESLRPSGRSTV